MDSDSSGDFNTKNVESDNENEEKLDKNIESNNQKEEEKGKKEDNFNIESNEPDNNGKIEDIKEKPNLINNNIESTSLNKRNQIIFNIRKDLIIIEIDKEKTSQKGYTVYQLNLIRNRQRKNFSKRIYSISTKFNK